MKSTRARVSLQKVQRGRAADELVLLGIDGRAILLRGDGLTAEESIVMANTAFLLLGGRPEPQAETIPTSRNVSAP